MPSVVRSESEASRPGPPPRFLAFGATLDLNGCALDSAPWEPGQWDTIAERNLKQELSHSTWRPAGREVTCANPRPRGSSRGRHPAPRQLPDEA